MPHSPSPALPSAPGTLLNTRFHVETPEGIDLALRPAGLLVRALAFATDLGLRGLILGFAAIVLALLGQLGMGLGAILYFLVNWWYMVLFEVLNQGQSPGKQFMGLRVVHD
uniref:RDD family protein n=1 Tax=Pseudomonas viridiflava TaxID=33069 RepID=UPI0013DF1496